MYSKILFYNKLVPIKTLLGFLAFCVGIGSFGCQMKFSHFKEIDPAKVYTRVYTRIN